MTRLRAHASSLVLALLALLACLELAWGLLLPSRVPTDDDWRALASRLRTEFRVGQDALVVSPDWLSPIARQQLGDLFTIDAVAPVDLDRFARVFTVALSGSHLDYTRREQSPAIVQHDFIAHATDARITSLPTRGGDEIPCRTVAPRIVEIDYKPHRALLIPAEADRIVRLDYADVELGNSLVGYTGIHDYFARKNSDAPVDLRVSIDGQEKLHVRHHQRDGWRRFTIDTTPLAGTRHAIRFEISAEHPKWRSFALAAEARK